MILFDSLGFSTNTTTSSNTTKKNILLRPTTIKNRVVKGAFPNLSLFLLAKTFYLPFKSKSLRSKIVQLLCFKYSSIHSTFLQIRSDLRGLLEYQLYCVVDYNINFFGKPYTTPPPSLSDPCLPLLRVGQRLLNI